MNFGHLCLTFATSISLLTVPLEGDSLWKTISREIKQQYPEAPTISDHNDFISVCFYFRIYFLLVYVPSISL